MRLTRVPCRRCSAACDPAGAGPRRVALCSRSSPRPRTLPPPPAPGWPTGRGSKPPARLPGPRPSPPALLASRLLCRPP
eukprot:11174902-Lingulodinium_polyedra.AAC.1